MAQPFRTVVLALAALCLASSSSAQQHETPPGGEPVPWAAISIRPTDPADPNGNWGDQPNGITDRGTNLSTLISGAYGFSILSLREDEIEGLPAWAKSARYDVVARVDPDDVPAFRKLSDLSMEETAAALAARRSTGEMLMEQALLTDRFHLKVHWQLRERSVYLLTVAKGGVKMKPAADLQHGSMNWSQGKLSGKGLPGGVLAGLLGVSAGRTVLDHANLTGRYDFDLHFAPENLTATGATGTDPDFFTAVQEQLGLKLESGKAQVPVLVIDHIEPPTPN